MLENLQFVSRVELFVSVEFYLICSNDLNFLVTFLHFQLYDSVLLLL